MIKYVLNLLIITTVSLPLFTMEIDNVAEKSEGFYLINGSPYVIEPYIGKGEYVSVEGSYESLALAIGARRGPGTYIELIGDAAITIQPGNCAFVPTAKFKNKIWDWTGYLILHFHSELCNNCNNPEGHYKNGKNYKVFGRLDPVKKSLKEQSDIDFYKITAPDGPLEATD